MLADLETHYSELDSKVEQMEITLAEIGRLASWHYDEDADFYNDSPDDMTAHINGLIVRLAAPYTKGE